MDRESSLVTVGVEAFAGRDAEGAPAYDEEVEIGARPVRTYEVVTGTEGEHLVITLEVRVPADATYVPKRRDRLNWDGQSYIVEMRRDVQRLRDSSSFDHHKIQCRDEPS